MCSSQSVTVVVTIGKTVVVTIGRTAVVVVVVIVVVRAHVVSDATFSWRFGKAFHWHLRRFRGSKERWRFEGSGGLTDACNVFIVVTIAWFKQP